MTELQTRTKYVHDIDGEVISEYNSSSQWLFTNIQFGGGLLATYSGGSTGFFHRDHLGSTRLITLYSSGSPSFSVSDNMDYLPYGEQIAGGNATSFKFTGKERDGTSAIESGLDNFGARYNSSAIGRFMSPDPDNAGASPDSPQSWNAYAYVGNGPLSTTDPDGLAPDPCEGKPPDTCIWVIGDPGPIPPVVYYTWKTIWLNVGGVANRTTGYFSTAWNFWVNTSPNSGCVNGATAGGAVGGAIIGAKAGFGLGAAAGTIGGTILEPGGGTAVGLFGGGALGGTAGGIVGAGVGGAGGWLIGQVACRTGGGGGGGGGRSNHDKTQSGQANRQVGDANRVIREGRKFTDSDSGYTVHVSGDRVVITDPADGDKIVTRFTNSAANTQERIQSGKWIPQ